MPTTKKNEILIVKSIETELRNYKYWENRKKVLFNKEQDLENRMYSVSAVSYDTPIGTSDAERRNRMLLNWITEKNELYNELYFITLKKDFVDQILEEMEDNDRNFIKVTLIDRRYYDTNDAIAMRLNLTESGVRYKIDNILRKTMKKFIGIKED